MSHSLNRPGSGKSAMPLGSIPKLTLKAATEVDHKEEVRLTIVQVLPKLKPHLNARTAVYNPHTDALVVIPAHGVCLHAIMCARGRGRIGHDSPTATQSLGRDRCMENTQNKDSTQPSNYPSANLRQTSALWP